MNDTIFGAAHHSLHAYKAAASAPLLPDKMEIASFCSPSAGVHPRLLRAGRATARLKDHRPDTQTGLPGVER